MRLGFIVSWGTRTWSAFYRRARRGERSWRWGGDARGSGEWRVGAPGRKILSDSFCKVFATDGGCGALGGVCLCVVTGGFASLGTSIYQIITLAALTLSLHGHAGASTLSLCSLSISFRNRKTSLAAKKLYPQIMYRDTSESYRTRCVGTATGPRTTCVCKGPCRKVARCRPHESYHPRLCTTPFARRRVFGNPALL